jgi:DNA-binding transcriptional LysR family regulator
MPATPNGQGPAAANPARLVSFVARGEPVQEAIGASLQDIAAFVAVAQTRSFTHAATRLGSNKSSVGKAVQRLERHLGVRLFQRTTRAVHLTEDGTLYLSAALGALERLRDAEQTLAAQRAEPVGRVRIDLPAGFGRLVLPTLGALRARHPRLVVEMALSDRMSDAVGEGWDIVVRIGQLPADSDMTVRRIRDMKLGLYAAPSYLQGHAPLAGVADLSAHEALVFRSPSGQLRAWPLGADGAQREFVPTPSLILGDGNALVEAALMGFGIAQMLDGFVQPHVATGQLVHLLPDLDAPGPPVHALIPVGRRMSAKTRVVLDHLVETLQE